MSGSPLDQILAENPMLAEHLASNPEVRAYLEKALQASPQLFEADRALAKEWQDRLSQHRDWLVRTEYEVSAAYDKTLVTLATGALALSVALLNALNLDPSDDALLWLRLGWVTLVSSIVTLLASVAAGRISLRHAISFTDQMLENPPSLIQSIPTERKPEPKRWSSSLTILLTALASLLFASRVSSSRAVSGVLYTSQPQPFLRRWRAACLPKTHVRLRVTTRSAATRRRRLLPPHRHPLSSRPPIRRRTRRPQHLNPRLLRWQSRRRRNHRSLPHNTVLRLTRPSVATFGVG